MNSDDRDVAMRRVAAGLAVLVVLGFFAVLVLMMFKEMPAPNKDSVIQMLGALILAFGGLMGYLYGSSKSADATNRVLAERSKLPDTPGDPVVTIIGENAQKP